MSKTKDLVGVTFRVLGVSGLVASLGLAASGCLTAAVAGAAAYGGTKMAQKGSGSDMEKIRDFYSKVCYQENGKEVCVCGGDLYRNNSNAVFVLRGQFTNDTSCPSETYCNKCIFNNESEIFGLNSYKGLRHYDTWFPSKE